MGRRSIRSVSYTHLIIETDEYRIFRQYSQAIKGFDERCVYWCIERVKCVEERERMETVPMGNGSKEELFEKGHPVIRELKGIPEIIFEEQIGMLP